MYHYTGWYHGNLDTDKWELHAKLGTDYLSGLFHNILCVVQDIRFDWVKA